MDLAMSPAAPEEYAVSELAELLLRACEERKGFYVKEGTSLSLFAPNIGTPNRCVHHRRDRNLTRAGR
jgi:hypothetical protein